MKESLNHIGADEFAFFVKTTTNYRHQVYKGQTVVKDTINNFENWEKGKLFGAEHPESCDMKNCFVIGVAEQHLPEFLKNCKQVYQSVECVYVPDGKVKKYTIEGVNFEISGKQEIEKTREEKQADELADLKQQLAEMKERLNNVVVSEISPEEEIKRGRKPKNNE